MSFTALRSSSLTTFKSTTSKTTNSIVSSFENTSWKSLVSILQEASISLFSNHEQKTNKQSQHVPSSSSSSTTFAPWMRYNDCKHHDILSSSKYPCSISIHGMPIQTLSASSAVGSEEDNAYNLQLFQIPIELESEHVVHDAEDDDNDGIVVDNNGKTDENSKESNNNDTIQDLSTWLISTLKRRKKKMNKHKLRKRRKLERLKSKK